MTLLRLMRQPSNAVQVQADLRGEHQAQKQRWSDGEEMEHDRGANGRDGDGPDWQQEEKAGKAQRTVHGVADRAADDPGRDVGAERIERPQDQSPPLLGANVRSDGGYRHVVQQANRSHGRIRERRAGSREMRVRVGRGTEDEAGTVNSRTRFVAMCGMAASALSALVILAQWLAIVVFGACMRA